MRIGPIDLTLRRKDVSLDTLMERLESMFNTVSGIAVTPETCMRSPTVHAIVTAVSRRLSVSPVQVIKKSKVNGRSIKEVQPDHAVADLLRQPNPYQTSVNYWLDATSTLVRYGRYYAFKGQGGSGPIRRLQPLSPRDVKVQLAMPSLEPMFVSSINQTGNPWTSKEIHHVRGAARNFLEGDSPVEDVRESIAMEIAIEQFGAAFFGNGAMPLVLFKLMDNFKDFKDDAARDKFVAGYKEALGGGKRFSAMMLPKGMDMDTVDIENDKAQFNETRKLIRTVIAGAWGVPPHMVGDLERATFNNVEQQDKDFTVNVVLPYAVIFQSAMERDLLTEAERKQGLVIRFNLDAVARADFKSQREGLRIERQMGVISANDWLEMTNRNPISEDDGGDDYVLPLNMGTKVEPGDDDKPDDDKVEDEEGGATDPQKDIRGRLDTYGIGVRAGVLTPQIEDEEAFRAEAGLPELTEPIKAAWSKDEGTRRPVTLTPAAEDNAQPIDTEQETTEE